MPTTYYAFLSGAEEVPPVQTIAGGSVTFILSPDEEQLSFLLDFSDLYRFTQAHIHLGERGEVGPIVVYLYDSFSRPITIGRGNVTGTITKQDFVGPLKGESFAALLARMDAGGTYVNVHTTLYPPGEIRGQISYG
ncbi:CHRD domain-containing protein [Mechercharimyces sp. CAU 1602]|uniref:CHRD domain-containing protein n=1 Tax=Mechercharimyces sp. CAU 1602 TaxID=2973933 RepID=UPI0021636FDB|nr:CHRD domain-containing protein [Mechercharimyces sp. CAU 1602]MCS1352080.1 CHRD domain-containing protein [Mechercharimyces sp. CAU 1602]